MTTHTAQSTTTTAPATTTTGPATETLDTCNYSPPPYKTPPVGDYFSTVGDAPLPGGGTLTVRFRSVSNEIGGTTGLCSLASSIGGARASNGKKYFVNSNGSLSCHRDMRAPLTAFANTVNYFSTQCGSGYGTLQTIGEWGGQRPQRLCGTSYHCEAKAVDIYWLEWSGGVVSRPCSGAAEAASSVAAHRRLVAVEAGLRKCFGYVLARKISNHHNHFHVDNGCGIALRLKSSTTSRTVTSCNYFIQDCVGAFVAYGESEQNAKPAYDGAWNDVSVAGYRRLLSDFGMSSLDPVRNVSHYMIFLDFVMMHGFANRAAGAYRWGRVPVL